MIESILRRATTGPAAHDEQPDRRRQRVRDCRVPAQVAIEPVQAQTQVVIRQMTVQRRLRPEVGVSREGHRPLPMGPRPHHQPHRARLHAAESGEILGRRERIGIVPAAHEHHRRVGEPLVVGGGAKVGLRPERTEGLARPHLYDEVFVFRGGGQGRMAGKPGIHPHPRADVLSLQRGPAHRIGGGRRCLQRVFVGPGQLLELEGPALADAAVIAAGEPA